jgi:hypothetical protein
MRRLKPMREATAKQPCGISWRQEYKPIFSGEIADIAVIAGIAVIGKPNTFEVASALRLTAEGPPLTAGSFLWNQ